MPTYFFVTNIQPGDSGPTIWANEVGTALNALGPLVDTKVPQTRTVAGKALSSNITLTSDDITDGTTAKQFLATERTKLSGIATSATANDTDANLKARANHTGTQLASTISDFSTAADARVAAATDLVRLTGTQTVAGVKTFSSSPVVPDSSFTIAKTTGLQTALDAKAPLSSPALTGTPTAPTPTTGDNSTKVATTAFVQATFVPASNILVWKYASGAYPTLPSSKPTGVEVVQAYGPIQPSTVPTWIGLGSTQAIGKYEYAALT